MLAISIYSHPFYHRVRSTQGFRLQVFNQTEEFPWPVRERIDEA